MAEDGFNQTVMPEECSDVIIDSTSQFFMVFLYSVTCVMSICGNFGVIRVVARIEALHTFSNFFLLSLATADLLIGLTMNPVYIVFVTVEATPTWLGKMEQFVWIATVAASTLSLSAVSMDRYIAITSPLIYPQRMNEKRCLGAILSIWIFSFAFASLRFALHDFKQLRKLWITTSVVTVFIPISIIAFCYFHIFKVVRFQTRSIRECSSVHQEDQDNDSSSASQRVEAKKNRKAALTVAIIIGLFLLMFLPSVVIFIVLLVVTDPCLEMKLNVAWLWAAGVSFVHSAINPWVYALRSSEFRRAVKAVYFCRE